MLIQHMQRPLRLIALLSAICLLYLCFNYLKHVEFSGECVTLRPGGLATHANEFKHASAAGAKPDMVPSNGSHHSYVAKVGVAVNGLDIPIVHRAFKTHAYHNEQHGYKHFIARREVVSDLTDHDRMRRGSGTYTKPAYLLSIVIEELLKPEEERLKWLFWFDSDTIILNPSTPLEVFLPPDTDILNDVHMMIASNWDGINSGIFCLRVHPWTASMLSAVLAYPIFEKERTEHDTFRDQSAFSYLLTHKESPLAHDRLKHEGHWANVPMRWFNSFPVNNAFFANGTWLYATGMKPGMFDDGTTEVYNDGRDKKVQPWKVMRGDMVLHFAGTKNVRDSWMTPWLERAEALLPEWNDPNHTKVLEKEVGSFWRDYKEKMEVKLDAHKKEEEKERQRKLELEKVLKEEKKKAEELKRIEMERKKEEEEKKKNASHEADEKSNNDAQVPKTTAPPGKEHKDDKVNGSGANNSSSDVKPAQVSTSGQ